ncbi:MAG: hypothetical protein ACC660_05325 [Acidimicrobiales bacterium]
MSTEAEATGRMLDKLRSFYASLDGAEREAFAALVGPGVALAHTEDAEVSGFTASWQPQRLPAHLAESIRDRGLRVEGF